MGNINSIDPKKCMGCMACYNKCPLNCIGITLNSEGFYAPIIDSEKCVNCGLCASVCPVNHSEDTNPYAIAYACYALDKEARMSSSSGGIFRLLAEAVLSKGGIIFGAAFTSDWQVAHIKVSNLDQLIRLQGSKYVQSNIGYAYREVQDELLSGRLCLFTGTACQVSGLKNYLGKNYDNLLVQDLVCHSIPSPGIWKKYMESYCGTDALQRVSFRDKSHGWFSGRISFYCGEDAPVEDDGLFIQAFLNGLINREACYTCGYKGTLRQSDITLADCWGWKDIVPDFDPKRGISFVMIHSDKGKEIWNEISARLKYKKVNIYQCLVKNQSATVVQHRYSQRRVVFDAYKNNEAIVPAMKKALQKTKYSRGLQKIKKNTRAHIYKKKAERVGTDEG